MKKIKKKILTRNKRYVNIEAQHTETNVATQKQIIWKGVNKMNEKIYYNAEDIAAMLGISMGKAYKILREMNQELSSKGFLTIAGKIPVAYFKEKWYGGAKEVCTCEL